jgi:hypothetical protein
MTEPTIDSASDLDSPPPPVLRCPACGWRGPGSDDEDYLGYESCPRCNGALVAASSLQGYAVRLVDDLDDATTEVLSLEQQLLEARQDQARRREALQSWLEQSRAADEAWQRETLRCEREALQGPTGGRQ